MNSVSTDIIHIHSKKLHYYKGNYDSFKKTFAEQMSQQRKAYEKQQKIIQQEKRAKQKKEEKTKASSKAKRDTKVLRAKQTKVASKTDKNSSEDQQIERPEKDYEVMFEFPDPENLNIPIIQVSNVSFSYSPDKPIFKNLDFGIDMESRIALVGPNGTGKTTLLKLLQGDLEPTSGSITRNRKLVIGRFSQHFVDQLDMEKTPVEYLMSKFPSDELKEGDYRKMLGRFGLTGKTHIQPIHLLSGGQKSRVVFAEICMRFPHLLFLDEPTNHLDIESVDALAEALNEFQGGFVLVSHDARLISEVCNEVWVCGTDQTVTIFEGDFDDYRAMLVEKFEEKLKQEEEERLAKEIQRKKEREEKKKIQEKKGKD